MHRQRRRRFHFLSLTPLVTLVLVAARFSSSRQRSAIRRVTISKPRQPHGVAVQIQRETGAISRTALLAHRLKVRRLARARATARQLVRTAAREQRSLRVHMAVEDSAIGSFLPKMSLKHCKLFGQLSAGLRVRPIGRRARSWLVALGHLLDPRRRLIQCTSRRVARTCGTSIRRTTCDRCECLRRSASGRHLLPSGETQHQVFAPAR